MHWWFFLGKWSYNPACIWLLEKGKQLRVKDVWKIQILDQEMDSIIETHKGRKLSHPKLTHPSIFESSLDQSRACVSWTAASPCQQLVLCYFAADSEDKLTEERNIIHYQPLDKEKQDWLRWKECQGLNNFVPVKKLLFLIRLLSCVTLCSLQSQASIYYLWYSLLHYLLYKLLLNFQCSW